MLPLVGTSLVTRGLAVLLGFFQLTALATSQLHLECSVEQALPARALVCEYSMLGHLNERFAELQDQAVLAGRAGNSELKRWVSARDACKDVECLDRLFETGIREASLVLAEADRREPAPLLTNARGIPLRIVQKNATNIPAPPDAVQEKAVAERSVPETAASLVMVLFLVAALAYTFVARRLAA